ncbi:MAG: PilN domain-containing protein [Proteobacteria bacterium]|nr:PilN domain-containing protein [Pseudomonadota bacterium]
MASVDWFGNDAMQFVRRGVTWWLNELTALIPRRFLGRIDAAPAVLEVGRNDATLLLRARGAAEPERMPVQGDLEAIRSHVRTVMRRWLSHAVVVRLDRSLLFETSTTLPVAAEASLRPILQHQLDRLVPLPASDVEFEYTVDPYEAGAKTITVRLIVATSASMERARDMALSIGLTPTVIVAQARGGSDPVTLWRARDPHNRTKLERWVRHGLEATAVLLLIGAYATYVYRLDGARAELQQQVARAGKTAATVRDLMQQIDSGESAIALLQRRQRSSDYLRLLDELTNLVPRNTWISQLSVRGSNVEIIGFSPRVADLVAKLEENPTTTNPRFRAPITRSADGTTERFDISFDMSIEDPK